MGTYEGNEGKKAKEMEKKYTRGEIKVKKGVWVSHANNKIEIEREVKELKITKNESLAEEKNLSKDTFFFFFFLKKSVGSLLAYHNAFAFITHEHVVN